MEKRCLRFICYDFECNYETLLQMNKLEGLQIILLKTLLMEVYKCMNNMNLAYLYELFNLKHLTYNLQHRNKCVVPKVRTVKHRIESFAFYGSICWNKLPFQVKSAGTLNDFKHLLTSNICNGLQKKINL